MERLEPAYINRVFKNAASMGGEMLKEAQQAGSDFVRNRMRELSFHRKVMQPREVTPDECIPRSNADTFYKIVSKDIKEAKAMAIPFLGNVGTTYFTGPRYEIDFYRIKSDKWNKSIDELDVYSSLGIPITKIIEDELLVALHKVEDTKFKAALDQIITDHTSQRVYTANTILNKTDFINLFKILTVNKLRPGKLLMAENTLYDIWTWAASEIGYDTVREIFIDGYKYDRLMKYPVVTTIKRELVPDTASTAEVWCLAPVESIEEIPTETDLLTLEGNYLGVSYILKDGQLIVDTREDEISLVAREIIASGISNTGGVAVLKKE